MNALFVRSFALMLFFFVFLKPAHSQELTVTCTAPGTCTANTADPLFESTVEWYPGQSQSRTVLIQNQSGTEKTISTRASNTSQTGDLDNVLILTITQASSGLVVYSGSLRDFYTQTSVPFGVFATGVSDEFTFTVSLGDVGNEYQGAQTQFDLLFDFFADDTVVDSGVLSVTKFNSAGTGTRAPGESLVYTIQLNVGDSALQNVAVTDLPPDGITYLRGSWTATSNVRGNLKSTMSEPGYASPGTWNIGTVVPNEVITLQYRAEVSRDQDPGVYRDLAWAAGQTAAGQPVVANRTANNPDPFVGSEVTVRRLPDTETVRVVQREERISTESSQNVLGASTSTQRTLPKTGASALIAVLGVAFFATGLWLVRKSLPAVLVVLGFFVFVPSTFAADVSVRVGQPRTPTNEQSFPLTFVALDLLNRQVSVTCLVKRPGSAAFVAFQGKTLRAGGDSQSCEVNRDVLSTTGDYQFQVTATAGGETDISQVVSVSYRNVAEPGTPDAYAKEKVGSCQYKISFKTASDDGKTKRVEVYRSASRTFRADSGTRVEDTAAGSGQDFTFFNTPPDCDRTYYYAVRAFNEFGDGSGIVGDREIVVTTTTSSTTTTTAGTTTQGQVAGAGGAAPGAPGEVAGTDTGAGGADEEASLPAEQVLGVLTGTPEEVPPPNNRTVIFGGIALGIGILLLTYAFFSRKKQARRS